MSPTRCSGGLTAGGNSCQVSAPGTLFTQNMAFSGQSSLGSQLSQHYSPSNIALYGDSTSRIGDGGVLGNRRY